MSAKGKGCFHLHFDFHLNFLNPVLQSASNSDSCIQHLLMLMFFLAVIQIMPTHAMNNCLWANTFQN